MYYVVPVSVLWKRGKPGLGPQRYHLISILFIAEGYIIIQNIPGKYCVIENKCTSTSTTTKLPHCPRCMLVHHNQRLRTCHGGPETAWSAEICDPKKTANTASRSSSSPGDSHHAPPRDQSPHTASCFEAEQRLAHDRWVARSNFFCLNGKATPALFDCFPLTCFDCLPLTLAAVHTHLR